MDGELFFLMDQSRGGYWTFRKDGPPRIFQLKISLEGTSPPIWRRVLACSYLRFPRLHEIIQECFYWSDYHLHEFYYYHHADPRWRIVLKPRVPEDQDFGDKYDIGENEVRLCDVFRANQKLVHYLYNLGANWEYAVRLDKNFPNDGSFRSFLCVDGRRAAPPEDVGGVYGYQKFLEIMKDPDHPEHEELRGWIEGEFDPDEIRSPLTKMTPKKIEEKYGPSLAL